MTSEALSSLTGNYTDSEGEDTVLRYTSKKSHSKGGQNADEPKKQAVRRARLVSYLDDSAQSEDEGDKGYVPSVVGSGVILPPSQVNQQPSASSLTSKIEDPPLPVYSDVNMPPEPRGACSFELQQKIEDLTAKMKTTRTDMNEIIQGRKTFRNPSIYEKLIQFCDINEFGTNYEPQLYDPLKWNKNSYYDELAKLQKQDMDQREKDRREKSTNKRLQVEFVIGTKRSANGSSSSSNSADEDVKKRKSKWDQVGIVTSNGIVKPPPGIIPLTSSVTGTKGTSISAFGSLPKKPKP